MATWLPYVITLPGLTYHGITEMELADKLKWLIANPPWWFGAVVGNMKITPLAGRRLKLDRALMIEVISTVTAYKTGSKNQVVRGGPYATKKIGPCMRFEIDKCFQALQSTRSDSVSQQIAAVQSVNKTLPANSPLHCHLKHLCFHCQSPMDKGPCKCKHLQKLPDPPCHPKAKHKKRYMSGAQKRKLKNLDPMDDEYRIHKWGPNYEYYRRLDNRKYPNRGSGKRRR